MTRGRWIYDERIGELVEADKFVRTPPKRSSLPSPGVITDTMEQGVQSMLDGKIYTSKSALRATYRQAGVLEVGNDPQRHKPFKRKPIDRKAVRTSLEKAQAKLSRGEYTEETRRKHI